MKYFLLFIIIITTCSISCESYQVGVNSRTAKNVSEHFSREYTGLDTLIRIDGYYYNINDTGLLFSPFMVSNNREFNILYYQTNNHNRIQHLFSSKSYNSAKGTGYYSLSGDTIKARWAIPYQFNSYDIFSQQFLIVNDTTLRKIYHLCETCSADVNERQKNRKDEIYKFYKYSID